MLKIHPYHHDRRLGHIAILKCAGAGAGSAPGSAAGLAASAPAAAQALVFVVSEDVVASLTLAD